MLLRNQRYSFRLRVHHHGFGGRCRKMEAVNRSFARMVLADHSKFDKVTAVTFAGIEKHV